MRVPSDLLKTNYLRMKGGIHNLKTLVNEMLEDNN
jgi:hypothetical protein